MPLAVAYGQPDGFADEICLGIDTTKDIPRLFRRLEDLVPRWHAASMSLLKT